MQSVKRRVLTMGLVGAGLAGAFYAGLAFAADQNLADADNNVEKAIALLQAAQNPGVNPPFGTHRGKAILALKAARKEIKKAQDYQDNPPAPKKPHHHPKKK